MRLLVIILLAHLVGDFILQPTSWVNSKMNKGITSSGLWKHITIHLILLIPIYFLYPNSLLGLVIILGSHILIDIIKIGLNQIFTKQKQRIATFIIDQILHLLIILGVCYCLYDAFDLKIIYQEKNLWVLLGYLFLSLPTATIIKELLAPYEEDIIPTPIEDEPKWRDLFIQRKVKPIATSLKNGGKYIGIIERILIFTFILIGQWTAVGLLITAKSVFRFGDLNQGKNRQFTEYVLIGTLLSFTFAIFVAILIKRLI